ncbi:MAG TPA: RimK family alpha-L-glutamate ligase [Anaeromyxobacteraceae bacterium]|nr:RimK family alpha-L-glutamate ligase [Anaeromyxobacteraceae bacterium]
MRLTVLSRSARIYTTRRLVEAARERGHQVRVVDPLEVELGLGGAGPALYHGGRPFPRTDAVVPRIGLSITQYGLAVVNQLELSGIPVLNGAGAISATRNKMRCLQLLAASGVRVPTTVMASNPSGLKEMVRLVGGMPVLVKLVSPGEKTGVMVCETLPSLESALEAIQGLGQNVIVQQYLLGGRGRDLRLLVVGGRVVAALRRRPRTGRMARTLASGARFEAVEPRPAFQRAALAAARIVGLEVCAVDMLEVRGGPRVFEVNSSPGIREAEEACGVDVAAAIVERAAALASRARPAAPARPAAS